MDKTEKKQNKQNKIKQIKGENKEIVNFYCCVVQLTVLLTVLSD